MAEEMMRWIWSEWETLLGEDFYFGWFGSLEALGSGTEVGH